METKNLENRLNEIRDTLIELEKLKTDIKFISNKEEDYFNEVVKNSIFFYRVYHNSIRLFVIDICKLLNPNEHFSIIKTLNFILSNRNQIKWRRVPISKRIIELRQKMESLNFEHLEQFKNLRDKHFAHNDGKKFEFESKVTLKLCWEILTVLQEIFVELNIHLLNVEYVFSIIGSKPNEIVALARYMRIKKLIHEELKSGSEIGRLQKVRDISRGKTSK